MLYVVIILICSSCWSVQLQLQLNLAGIKFGEMAEKDCILILAKFKFGDLELYL